MGGGGGGGCRKSSLSKVLAENLYNAILCEEVTEELKHSACVHRKNHTSLGPLI